MIEGEPATLLDAAVAQHRLYRELAESMARSLDHDESALKYLEEDGDAYPDDVVKYYGGGPSSLAAVMLQLERAMLAKIEVTRKLRRRMLRLAAQRRGIVH